MNKLDDKAVRYETSVNQLNRVLDNRLNTSLSGAFKAGYKEAIEEACVAFCKRCVHNQTLKKCMYLEKDCPLLGAFIKDLEE